MRSERWRAAILLAAGVLLGCLCGRMYGQAVNATLLGTVTDASGAVVPKAKVEVKEVNTGITRSAETNDSGNYVFADLQPGKYQVSAEKQGFKKEIHSAVDVLVNTTVRVDLKLEPGTLSEVVEVTADAPILQTDRVDTGRKIETRQVEELPLGFNRNFQGLLNLVPGTTRAHREHSEFFNPQDTLSTEVNGQSRLFNNLLVEGVDDNERTGLLQVYVPPAEAIQTVDVTTSNYAAEFGRAGGAVTNVVLKSGTNAFHGAAYEFNRVSALAARTFFNRTPAPFPRTTYNYYGGDFGGPIIKNKLFFFGDILRIDDSRGRSNRVTVPTDDFRNGNFSAVLPQGVTVYNPFTPGAKSDGTGRQPFSYQGRTNVIDPVLISPIAKRILDMVPHANVPGCPSPTCPLTNNFQNATRFLKNTTAFDTKLDYNRTDNDRLAFRFSRAVQDVNDQPIFGLAGGPGGDAGDGFQGTGVQHMQSSALNHTHVFSPTLISETRIGISHYRNVAHSSDFGTNASDAIGITGVNLNDFTSGLVDIRLSNNVNANHPLVGYSPSLPWDRGETNINLVNNWTKTHRNHTFKWGADIRRLRDDLVQAQTFSPRGRFDFGTGTTSIPGSKTSLANDFAALLIDMPTRVGRDISIVSGSWRETEVFTFVQDRWQVTPKLTLDAGVRWELYFPATPSRPGGFSNYDPKNNVLVIAGIGGNPMDLGRETSYHYFAPRVGIAYRLKENTVFRGGFGISYEPFPNNQYAWNFPVRQNNEFRQPNSFAPAQLPNGQPARMATGFPPPAPAVIPSNGLVAADPKEEYNVIDNKFRQPYVEAWNLAVQRALPHHWVLDVAYVGNHGVRIPVTFDLNAALTPGVDAKGNLLSDTCDIRPLCSQLDALGRRIRRTATTNFLFKPTSSNYHALQVKFDHKWASGFLLTTAYTFGKALAFRSDQGSSEGSVSNYLDFRRNYSVVSRNRKHTFVQSFVYELPFGRGKPFLKSGWANWIAGGWQLSGILTWMTGTPLNFTSSGDSLNAPGTTQTPIQIAPFRVLGGIDDDLWFDTAAFCPVGVTAPPAGCPVVGNGVLGNMQRYSFAGPRLFNLDAALFRRVSVSERVGLELRAEAFSVTNTPHFANPNTNATNTTAFGHIRSLLSSTDGGNRTMELGAKITF